MTELTKYQARYYRDCKEGAKYLRWTFEKYQLNWIATVVPRESEIFTPSKKESAAARVTTDERFRYYISLCEEHILNQFGV